MPHAPGHTPPFPVELLRQLEEQVRKKIQELKEKYNFCLLEDACAALGAEYADGSKVGTIGYMSSFSF